MRSSYCSSFLLYKLNDICLGSGREKVSLSFKSKKKKKKKGVKKLSRFELWYWVIMLDRVKWRKCSVDHIFVVIYKTSYSMYGSQPRVWISMSDSFRTVYWNFSLTNWHFKIMKKKVFWCEVSELALIIFSKYIPHWLASAYCLVEWPLPLPTT